MSKSVRTIDDFENIEDYLNYEYVKELNNIVTRNFDFEKYKWINLPFGCGFLDQEDCDSFKWQMINYIIVKNMELLNANN